MRTVHVLVQGTVQGVGFRYHCAYTAQELGVVGQVRNLPDGDVEVTAQGEPEAVGRLIAWLRHGPQWASVRRLTVTDLPDDARAPRSARRVGVWMAVIVIAAVLPVLAQTSLLSRVSTPLWLASMPLCILGCAMLAKELTARRDSRPEED